MLWKTSRENVTRKWIKTQIMWGVDILVEEKWIRDWIAKNRKANLDF